MPAWPVCPPQSCVMTYSRPQFDPVPEAGSSLYRFHDRGVPEHRGVECSLFVLFLPGHAGDYRQARSLGNEVLRAASAKSIGVHVYALSNDEAYGAFDGDVLALQAQQTAAALRFLCTRYRATQPHCPRIFVIGHSMGGIAALEALRVLAADALVPAVHVDALLLLSVPLLRPVLACSASLARLYGRVRGFWAATSNAFLQKLPAIASISGGCPDWQVPFALSSLHAASMPPLVSAVSVSTEDLLHVQTPTDHLSILWCNQLVRVLAHAVVGVAALPSVDNADAASPAGPSLAERVQAMRGALLSNDTAVEPLVVAADETALHWQSLPIRALLDAACLMLVLPQARELLLCVARSPSHEAALHWRELVLGGLCGLLAHVTAFAATTLVGGGAGESLAPVTTVGDRASSSLAESWMLATRVLAAAGLATIFCALGHLMRRVMVCRFRAIRIRLLVLAALAAALSHPAVGLLVAAWASADDGRGAPLLLCMLAALVPNLAAWLRHSASSPAVLYSSDARVSLCHVLLVLVAHALEAVPTGVAHLGMVVIVVYTCCELLEAHAGASTESVARLLSMGTLISAFAKRPTVSGEHPHSQ